jgi:hypothetical protein
MKMENVADTITRRKSAKQPLPKTTHGSSMNGKLNKPNNKQIVYCQSRRPQRSCIISTNLDIMIRLNYMISILIIYRYMYTSYIYMWGTGYWCMNTTNTMMTG